MVDEHIPRIWRACPIIPSALRSEEHGQRRQQRWRTARGVRVGRILRILDTTLACKLRKSSRVFTPATRWSADGAHCTQHCPQCLVCVVGALGRFPRCNVLNESREKGAFGRSSRSRNKFRKFQLRHIAVTTMHGGFGCVGSVCREDCPGLGLAMNHSQQAYRHETRTPSTFHHGPSIGRRRRALCREHRFSY